MNNEIFIEVGKRLTLKEYVPIASRTMSLITEASKAVKEIDETFSVTDIAAVLNKMSRHMSGAFEIRRTPSHYYQIVFNPHVFNDAKFEEEYVLREFTKPQDVEYNQLWITEEVLFAIMDRTLHGIPAAIYFYLGALMTQDDTFAISQNIPFHRILECCDGFPEDLHLKYQTTLMRALADLQDAALIEWNAESRTFRLLHITAYDPNQKV